MRAEFKVEIERLVQREVELMVREELGRLREELVQVKNKLHRVEDERDELRKELEVTRRGKKLDKYGKKQLLITEVYRRDSSESKGAENPRLWKVPRIPSDKIEDKRLLELKNRKLSPELKENKRPNDGYPQTLSTNPLNLSSNPPASKDHSLWKSFSENDGLAEIPNLRSKSWHTSISATQYSDDESMVDPQSSPIKVSPIKLSPIKVSPRKVTRESVQIQKLSPIKISRKSLNILVDRLPTQYTDSSSTVKTRWSLGSGIPSSQVEVVEDSEEEYALATTCEEEYYNEENGRDIVDHGEQVDEEVFQENREIFLEDREILLEDQDDQANGLPDLSPNREELTRIKNQETSGKISIPPLTPPFTTLQQRQHVKKFLVSNLGSITISLEKNPISEKPWIISDFRPNPHYNKKDALMVLTKTGSRKLGLTKSEEANRRKFYKMVGDEVSDGDSKGEGFEDRMSQIFDKFPSPPGFMMSEFPNTQEDLRRREVVAARQQRRIQRRVTLCVLVKNDKQIGEFIFAVDILNEYVLINRYNL